MFPCVLILRSLHTELRHLVLLRSVTNDAVIRVIVIVEIYSKLLGQVLNSMLCLWSKLKVLNLLMMVVDILVQSIDILRKLLVLKWTEIGLFWHANWHHAVNISEMMLTVVFAWHVSFILVKW